MYLSSVTFDTGTSILILRKGLLFCDGMFLRLRRSAQTSAQSSLCTTLWSDSYGEGSIILAASLSEIGGSSVVWLLWPDITDYDIFYSLNSHVQYIPAEDTATSDELCKHR